MTREIGVLDEAIAAAEKRGDPLQHAYRAVAFERLHRVYQRDRTSRSATSAVFWGAYGLLFWAFAFTVPRSPAGAIVALAATASSFLSLRAWARWVSGTRVLEAPANESYVKALAQARQSFINATANLSALPDGPKATAMLKARLEKVKPETWRVLLFMLPVGTAAVLLANLTSGLVRDNRDSFEVATQTLATLAAGCLAAGMWKDLQRIRNWLGIVLGQRWKTPYFLAVLGVAAVLAWWAFGAMARALSSDASDPANRWGWALVVAILALLDGWMMVGLVLRYQRRRAARMKGADSVVDGRAT